jgi:hypothetical protein
MKKRKGLYNLFGNLKTPSHYMSSKIVDPLTMGDLKHDVALTLVLLE